MKKLILILALLLLQMPTATPQVLPQQILDEYQEYICMFVVLYHEARNQKPMGQMWVAAVVLNRKQSNRFPADTVCGVVKQHRQFTDIHQTFRKLSSRGYSSLNTETRGKVATVAYDTLYGFLAQDGTNGVVALVPRDIYYYHTVAVRPHWSKVFKRAAIIGSHVFYRH